ncbi:MAG: hypothetical protein WCD31_00430 [Gillisia sp.]
MILKTFTSAKSSTEAIEMANKEIQEMEFDRYEVKQIAQSESIYYNSFAEREQFHFTLTILFGKRVSQIKR